MPGLPWDDAILHPSDYYTTAFLSTTLHITRPELMPSGDLYKFISHIWQYQQNAHQPLDAFVFRAKDEILAGLAARRPAADDNYPDGEQLPPSPSPPPPPQTPLRPLPLSPLREPSPQPSSPQSLPPDNAKPGGKKGKGRKRKNSMEELPASHDQGTPKKRRKMCVLLSSAVEIQQLTKII